MYGNDRLAYDFGVLRIQLAIAEQELSSLRAKLSQKEERDLRQGGQSPQEGDEDGQSMTASMFGSV